ncbi:lipopolysaccharide biosynthesis protein [Bacillus nitratireducens]|uniref:lipopolysaccharide biosynthesis protein n=1 Tax=Bacillus nitratireducens TaxID=2026193 RepID=UPI001BAB287F|nr:lipopolysaccharide biosynthesis protein [Bacillus nitratireducens]QUG86550.1 oligosaccharide flippase family protein [Bacillus nitratireducens]
MKNNELKGKIISATKWSAFSQIAAKIITPITNMILARILAPEAFGILAIITMIVSFVDMFTDAGFQKYLVQREFKDIKEKIKYTNVAFWTNLGVSFFLWGTIAVFNRSIAELVGNPDLGIAIIIACIQIPITAFSSIQMALYRRDFKFKTLFFVRIISIFIPLVITIPLAIAGLNYWALIIGTICGRIADAIILTVKSEWKPKFFYSLEILRDMLSFSIWSLIEAIAIWLTIWVDALIIGSFLNEYYVGLYKTSTTMVNSLLALITGATTPILFSALSRLQHDNERFNQTFFKMQRLISILVFPMGIGVFLYSELATQILLGNKWNEASGVIGVWALSSSITIVLGHYCSEVYRAKGRPKLSFLAQILHLVVLVPVCLISAKYGFWALVYTRSWIRLEGILVHFLLMKYVVGFPVMKMISNVLPMVISSVIMGITGYLLKQLNNGYAWSLLSILICIISYFSFLCLFPKVRGEIILILKKLIPKM